MPDTAKDRYKKVAAPDSESLAKNPVYAAEAAAMYLAEYGYKSGDTFNMQQALIAYNNGP
ncbi:MAG: transglycosylase SLT domain-containing protein [Candidatus Peribacteria bacterium]|nr:MAG: transglycosylase SLT domain-containing protein [Candidatus Peribacteria bacterium]